MTYYLDDDVPVEQTTTRNLVVLLLDASGSLNRPVDPDVPDGPTRLDELQQALDEFMEDGLQGSLRLQFNGEIAIATFGASEVTWLGLDPPDAATMASDGRFHFVRHRAPAAPDLAAWGNTPLWQALEAGMDAIEDRKRSLREAGVQLEHRPNLYVVSDMANYDPTLPDGTATVARLRREQDDRRFLFWVLPTSGADTETLASLDNGSNVVHHVQSMPMAAVLDFVSRSMDRQVSAAPTGRESNADIQQGVRDMLG